MSDPVEKMSPVPFITAAFIVLIAFGVAAFQFGAHVGETAVPHPSGSPLPVSLVGKLATEDSAWSIAAALASAIVAIATLALAWYTFKLADETRAALKVSREALDSERKAKVDEERRHQDSLMPHVALVCKDLGTVQDTLGGGFVKQQFGTKLWARNVGVGPALNVTVTHQTFSPGTGFLNIPAAIAAGEELWCASGAGGENLEYTVTYEDVFGRRFRSHFHGKLVEGSSYTWERL